MKILEHYLKQNHLKFKECLNEFNFTHLTYRKETLEEDYKENKIDDILIGKNY